MLADFTPPHDDDLEKEDFESLLPDLVDETDRSSAADSPNAVETLSWFSMARSPRNQPSSQRFARMDGPRCLDVHTLDEDHEVFETRPDHWRYWHLMLLFGQIAIFYHNWVQDAQDDRIAGRTNKENSKERLLDHCLAFERHLAQDHTYLLKSIFTSTKKMKTSASSGRKNDQKSIIDSTLVTPTTSPTTAMAARPSSRPSSTPIPNTLPGTSSTVVKSAGC